MILILFGLVGIGTVLAAIYIGRMPTKEAQSATIEQRVSAYMQTIRRTAAPDALNAMSDVELSDVLTAAAKRRATERTNRTFALFAATIVVVLVSIFVATSHNIEGFGISVVIGGIVLYGLDRAFDRQLRQKFESQGIDPDRLDVA